VFHTPFKEIDVQAEINKRLNADPELKEMWDNSRMEYRLLGELTKLRKECGLSQTDLAERIGSDQRVISRIEKREQSPTLKTLCNLANALNVEIRLVPR
jgi:DNA-binding XRE family transcriptional regulator